MYIQHCSNKLLQKIVLSDCISIKIRVSIRVRGLHLVLLPTHFQPLTCTHAVRSRERNSPHPFPVRSRPHSQARSSPAASGAPISSHSLAPTPSAAVRAILPTHLPSAAVRAAKLAHPQRLLLPNHFQPLPCTRAVRSQPRNSPHPFAVRSRARSHAR